MESIGEVLAAFLVLSLVFEMAMTPLFNWRIFKERLGGKGLKTPILLLLAFVTFWGYGLDIVRDCLVALGYEAALTLGGQILTALLIGGGSQGFFELFRRLGLRAPGPAKTAKSPGT